MSLLNKNISDIIIHNIHFHNPTLSLDILFPKSFIGFQGHFPNKPVLPGVVMIQVMIQMYELFKNKNYTLCKIKQAKFIEPVSAGEMISFTQEASIDKNTIGINGKVLKSNKIIAKLSLVLQDQIN